jgi:hypothetical protein
MSIELLIVYFLLIAAVNGIYIYIAKRTGLSLTWERGRRLTAEEFTAQVIMTFVMASMIIVGVFLAVYIFLILGVYQALAGAGNIPILILFFAFVGIGIVVMVIGAWRIWTYDPPLEKGKRKRKGKLKNSEVVVVANPESQS